MKKILLYCVAIMLLMMITLFIYDAHAVPDKGVFNRGLAMVYEDGKFGFVDSTGKEVIPFIYDFASTFKIFFSCSSLLIFSWDTKW